MIRASAQFVLMANLSDGMDETMKRVSRFNATTHGIFADIFQSGEHTSEERDKYCHLLSSLRTAILSGDCLEDLQVQTLAVLFVRLWRVYKADARIAPRLFARVQEILEQEHPEVTVEYVSRKDEVVVSRKEPTPDLLIRYEISLQRQVGRTLGQIEQRRRMAEGGLQSANRKG
jgi:hypothetical protein